MNKNLDYKIIFDEAADAIFIVNSNHKVIEVNQCACELSGYTKSELLNMALFELFPKEEMQNKPLDINGIESNEIILFERLLRTKDRKIIPIEMKSRKLSDGNYFSSFRDISTRTKIRSDLQDSLNKIKLSEFKYRELFNNIPLGIFIVKNNGAIESINQTMVEILGAPSIEDSLKFNIFELPSLKGTELLHDLKICFNKGRSFNKTYDYTSIWDKNSYVKAHILPAERANSEKVMVIIEDYTSQKERELELKILSEGVNNSHASVVVTDSVGKITFVNDYFLTHTNYSKEEVLGETFSFLKSAYHNPAFYSDLWTTIKSGKNWVGEILNKKKNGELFWENTMISSLKNEKGEITHYMAIKEDITKKKKNEQELKDAKEKAEQADYLKSSFLANMSHEIRTPLNAIMGFSALLNEYDVNSETSSYYINIIQLNGKKLLNIIDDVLLVSKLQVDQINVYSSAFSIKQLLKELYSYFKTEIELSKGKDVELILELNKKDNIEIIETDQAKLSQIFRKLIRNAIKFTSEGVISFGYDLNDNDEFVFFTKDTGIGIVKDKQRVIFQKFRQADDSKTRQFGGTGLGLSIVKGLIDLLHGKLWVDSEENKGTSFYFTVPLKIIKKKKKKNKKVNDKLKWKNKTILVVDDVKESVLFISEVLENTGMEIITASNGIEAIEQFAQNPGINLILMDIQLPILNGLAAAKRILIKKDVPIIIQSAYLKNEYEKKCLSIGCVDFIQKPLNSNEILAKVETHIR